MTEVKEAKEKSKSGINKTAILVALILGLSVVGYGYLSISYKNRVFEAEQKEKEKQEEEDKFNGIMLNACLKDAQTNYKTNWNSSCESLGLEEDCSLPTPTAERWDNWKSKEEEKCFKRYAPKQE